MAGKSVLRTTGFLTALVIISLLARMIITGGNPTVNLAKASALAGPVSIGIAQRGDGPLPEAGKDYQIKSAQYFDNNNWVVVKILPLKNKADPAILVLKKIDGIYQAVLGPAGEFNSSYFYVLPPDVGQYLTKQGAYSG